MHVILRPSARNDLDDIEITGALFAIGRQEPAFSGYDSALTSKLSRRHARLFEQDGFVYLADLGSLNGTSCNGRQIKQEPVEVQSGDLIEFGGLAFEAEVVAQQPATLPAPPEGAVQRLVLTPERSREVLEPIVVSSFPFLFDKQSDVFARHKASLKEALVYMSRHHAHIFVQEGELYIEDLGSTNGTFVSGRKLDERARRLKDGDLVALGTDRLTYSVHVLRSVGEGTTQVPSGIDAVDNPTRTIFVDSPTSFLDVYFVDDKDEDAAADADNGAAGEAGDGAAARPGLATQLSRSFFGGPVFGARFLQAVVGIVLIAALAGGLWYWQGREERAIQAAMDRQDFQRAAALAGALLAREPDNAAIRDLATRAALRRWVPAWHQALAGGDFDGAATVAAQAAAAVRDNDDAAPTIELLGWSAEVRADLSAPLAGGIGARIDRARTEARLLQWWQDDSFSHARSLDRVADILPEFRAAREQIYSDVRQLRSNVLDDQPLLALDDGLTAALAGDDLNRAGALIDGFVEDYPQFAGSQVLAEDLQRLRRLIERIDEQAWLAAVEQVRDDPFVSAPFAARGAALANRSLPDEATMARLEGARAAWRQGQLETAIGELRALADGAWPALGQSVADHYSELLDGYQALQDSRAEADYESRLFEYYAGLDEAEDGYLIGQLEQEFHNHAEAAARRADQYFDAARDAWQAYQTSGGIQPEHRLDRSVSTAFANRAGQLRMALESLGRSQRIHGQIARPLPAAWQSLEAEVSREVAFQRGQLRNLAFHEPEVQQRMLALLPQGL